MHTRKVDLGPALSFRSAARVATLVLQQQPVVGKLQHVARIAQIVNPGVFGLERATQISLAAACMHACKALDIYLANASNFAAPARHVGADINVKDIALGRSRVAPRLSQGTQVNGILHIHAVSLTVRAKVESLRR